MPYIKRIHRGHVVDEINDLVHKIIVSSDLSLSNNPHIPPDCIASFPGLLNYVITSIIHKCLDERGENYANYNEIIGVLECAKLELYRTKIGNYESRKAVENGNI